MNTSKVMRTILATIGILILLGALGALIWYDRQSKEKVLENSAQRQELQVQNEASKTENNDKMNSQSQEDQDKSLYSNDEEENLAVELGQALEGLTPKDEIQEFQGQEGKLVLRSLGEIYSSADINRMADTNSQFYKDQLDIIKQAGDEIIGQDTASHDYRLMMANIAPFIDYADVTIANLGMPIAYPQLPFTAQGANSGQALARNLKDLGVDIVSHANIHVLDQGRPGLVATLNNLYNVGLQSVGLYTDFEDRAQSRIVEANGISLGFLSYTYDLNGNYIEEGREYLVGLTDLAVMEEEIGLLAQEVDGVVVSIHLSQEASNLPSEEQEQIFQFISDAGADLILGNNPNSLQPATWINGTETFAMYSQGNFLSGNTELAGKQGGILQVIFEKDTEGNLTINSPQFMPSFVLGIAGQKYYQTVPLADYERYDIPEGNDAWKELQDILSPNIDIVSHFETKVSEQETDMHRQ